MFVSLLFPSFSNSLQVRLGNPDLNDMQGVVFRNIKKGLIHPNFNFNSVNAYFDVAIIEMDEPVEYSATIGPICFPHITRSHEEKQFDNWGAIVTGWGSQQRFGESSPQLRQTQVVIYPQR